MPLPLIPLAVATLAGWKFGATIETKVRGLFSRGGIASPRAVPLDPNLPKEMRADVENLLAHVKDPALLDYASGFYKAHGFPAAANALSARASYFLK